MHIFLWERLKNNTQLRWSDPLNLECLRAIPMQDTTSDFYIYHVI